MIDGLTFTLHDYAGQSCGTVMVERVYRDGTLIAERHIKPDLALQLAEQLVSFARRARRMEVDDG